MKIVIETEHLLLRELSLKGGDPEFILELVNTKGWLKYIGDKKVKTTEDAAKYISDGPMASYVKHGFGLWLVVRKETNAAIGICGILKRETLVHPDLGFAFLPRYEGCGFAFEAATGTLTYARGELKLTTLEAITVQSNVRSIALLERLGFSRKQSQSMKNDENELLEMELDLTK